MNFKYESFNYRLKVLSPLHIGTGEKLSGKEYYIHSDRVHIVDIPSLLKSNDDKIDKIIELLNKGKSIADSVDEENSDGWPCRYIIDCSYKPPEILPHIKSIYNEPYISGSSIKGSIRTSILYGLLQKDEWKYTVSEKLDSIFKRLSGKKDFEKKKLILQLSNEAGNDIERTIFCGKNVYNSMRGLQISDTDTVGNKLLEVSDVKIMSLSLREGVTWKKFSIYPETIKTTEDLSNESNDMELKGTIKIDNFLFEDGTRHKELLGYKEQIEGIKNFIKLCNNFSIARIDREIKFFNSCNLEDIARWYMKLKKMDLKDNQFLLQLGWGAGFESKTVATYLKDDYIENLRYYFNLGKKKIRTHLECNEEVIPSYKRKGTYFCQTCRQDLIKPADTNPVPFPKTRKIVFLKGKPFYPMGWALLTIEPKRRTILKEEGKIDDIKNDSPEGI